MIHKRDQACTQAYSGGTILVKQWYSKHKLIINTIFLVALTGMVFVYPFFQSHFRFTLGVPVLAALLLYFPKLPVISTALWSGLAVFFMRTVIYLPFGASELSAAVEHNLPATVYYIVYGACFRLFNVRGYIQQVPMLLLLLSFTDVLSNCIELLVRSELLVTNIETLLVAIITVGLIRSVLAIFGYYGLKQYRDFNLAEDRLSRYAELTVLTAQLKTELYYLQKSSQDIENVMEHSYLLYQKLNNHLDKAVRQNAGQALAVARDIHEVKKDYSRVVSGMEKVLESSATEKGMRLSEIFFIIEQNTLRGMDETGKQIELSMKFTHDFLTDQHYLIVSMLNNLIINAIEACPQQCKIEVVQQASGQDVQFMVTDYGDGIKPEDYEVIFEPGYSTKYCPVTGKMSTGLGLAHVKILAEYLQGKIEVQSVLGEYSTFIITLPLKSLANDAVVLKLPQ